MTYKFRASIPFYRADGVRVDMSVGADSEVAHFEAIETLLRMAYGRGYTTDAPTVGAGDKTENVCGYVVGTYDDKKSGEFRPCVHLYPDDKRQMKIVTVYPEAFHMLPFSVDGVAQFDGEAPKIDVARKRRVFHEYKFEVTIEPKKDFNGDPILSEAGNVVYKFKRAKAAAPVAAPDVMDITDRVVVAEVGMAIYGTQDACDRKLGEWCKRFSGDRADNTADLTAAEGVAIMAHANATGRGCVDALARKIGLSVDELGDVILTVVGAFTPVSELHGVDLSKVVAALVELHRNANAAPAFA